MRQHENLRRFPVMLDPRVIQHHREALWSARRQATTYYDSSAVTVTPGSIARLPRRVGSRLRRRGKSPNSDRSRLGRRDVCGCYWRFVTTVLAGVLSYGDAAFNSGARLLIECLDTAFRKFSKVTRSESTLRVAVRKLAICCRKLTLAGLQQ
jgi:hypothetical protein